MSESDNSELYGESEYSDIDEIIEESYFRQFDSDEEPDDRSYSPLKSNEAEEFIKRLNLPLSLSQPSSSGSSVTTTPTNITQNQLTTNGSDDQKLISRIGRGPEPHDNFKPKVPPIKVNSASPSGSNYIKKLPSINNTNSARQTNDPKTLDEYLEQRPNENQDSYHIRVYYSRLAKSSYGDQIDDVTAATIGDMTVNKIKYGVKYSDYYENIIKQLVSIVNSQ